MTLGNRMQVDQIKLTKSSSRPTRAVNIHGGKTQLSRLVDEAAKRASFFIAKAGKPRVKTTPLTTDGFVALELVPKKCEAVSAK